MPTADTLSTGEKREILQVFELVGVAREVLEQAFGTLWVEGEISNFAAPKSGHWYFTLKDQQAQVKCVMFRGANSRLGFVPEEGLQVLLKCKVSLYEARGDFQIIGEHMEVAGDGALRLAFEQLYNKLNEEGLFAPENKKELPSMVRHIGVITSPSGAAIRDILSVLGRRWPIAKISLLPATVQGDSSADELIFALQLAARYNQSARQSGAEPIAALILARGGGALEDLQSFNDESLARAIVASPIPVVAGIGHETDVTIAQLAADVYGSTPSAAAELLSPDQEEINAALVQLKERLILQSPERQLQQHQQRLDELSQRAQKTMTHQLALRRQALAAQCAVLASPKLFNNLKTLRVRLSFCSQKLGLASQKALKNHQARLHKLVAVLESLSPMAVLGRGFAMVRSGADIVSSVSQVQIGQSLQTQLKDGILTTEVTGVTPEPQPPPPKASE